MVMGFCPATWTRVAFPNIEAQEPSHKCDTIPWSIIFLHFVNRFSIHDTMHIRITQQRKVTCFQSSTYKRHLTTGKDNNTVSLFP